MNLTNLIQNCIDKHITEITIKDVDYNYLIAALVRISGYRFLINRQDNLSQIPSNFGKGYKDFLVSSTNIKFIKDNNE